MSCTSSIDIELYQMESIGEVLSVLHAVGWRFWPGTIQYRCFVEIGEHEISAVAPVEAWQELVPLWDEQCHNGRTVEIDYQWQDDEHKTVYVQFSRKPDYPQILHVEFLLFPSWEKLCGRVTDYSWYLSRTVCPMQQNNLGVISVQCFDHGI